MMFQENITKDEIQNLPLIRFDGDIHIVDDGKKIKSAVRSLQKHDVIGFDTEKKPTFLKGQYHPTALVQLSTQEEAFLFRLQEIGFNSDLKGILESPNISKVGISIRDDLEALKMISDFRPDGFVDLNDVAAEIGIQRKGVRNLSAIFLEKRISKNQQTSNWENKTLTPAQTVYAATDAWICVEIYFDLLKRGFIENGSV